MLEQRQLFCRADPVFYETPAAWRDAEAAFEATRRAAPAGWRRTEHDSWVVLQPEDRPLVAQGWKIHVSVTLTNAERALEEVWDYCTRWRLPFKFLRDRNMVHVMNSKYTPRGSSGKFATIYPRDEGDLRAALEALDARLHGEPGPYILSDLRYADGPLYVRYGGFVQRHCYDEDGVRVLAIDGPDGTLVPDRRGPSFTLPPWVSLPDFLAPHAEVRGGGLEDFPYRIEKALHFSNGGGVYLAERKADGQRVVLKEARPHAGLDGSNADAVERMQRERWALERLTGLKGVPALHEAFVHWEHHFLAVEHVEGDIGPAWLGTHHPLVQPDPTREDMAVFKAKTLALVERIEALVAEIHARGVVIGDLHPGNMLIRQDDTVSLIDFEVSGSIDDEHFRPPLGALGFAPWERVYGADIDLHALASLRLWFFLPLTRVCGLDPSKVDGFVEQVRRRFALPDRYSEEILARLRLRDAAGGSATATSGGVPLRIDLDAPTLDWAEVRDSMAAAITTSATPEREDRLFPGDIAQFQHNGAGFLYGAAGVLWALSVTGAPVDPAHERWLLDAAERLEPEPGFGTGSHGIAYALDHLGHAGAAARPLKRAQDAAARLRDHSLVNGQAGIGLTLADYATRHGDEETLDLAQAAGRRLAELLGDRAAGAPPDQPATGRGSATAGLLRGWSGPALLWIRLFEATGDEQHLDLALEGLARDLDACVLTESGALQVEETSARVLAYLDVGSSGIGLVADEFLEHREDRRLHDAVAGVVRACQLEFVLEPQLLNGRAGLLATLVRLSRRHEVPEVRAAVDRHIRRFGWHALSYRGHMAFPGDQGFRLSMDLGTGTAGVLFSIATALSPATPFLPFFGRRGDAPPPGSASARDEALV